MAFVANAIEYFLTIKALYHQMSLNHYLCGEVSTKPPGSTVFHIGIQVLTRAVFMVDQKQRPSTVIYVLNLVFAFIPI